MELQTIETALKSEPFETLLQAPSAEIPVERLLVSLPSDISDDLILELLYIPGLEKELEANKLLQFFTVLPCDVAVEKQVELQQLLIGLNVNLPVPSFGFREDDNLVYHKYVDFVPNQSDRYPVSAIVETIWLIAYIIDLFYEQIATVAATSKS